MISSPLRLTQGINIQYADIQLEIKFLDLPRDRAPVLGPTPAPLAAVAVTILSSSLQGFLSECGETASGQTVNNAISSELGERTGRSGGRGSDQPSQESTWPWIIPALCYNSTEKEGPKTSRGFRDFWSDKPMGPFTSVLILFSCCS